MIKILIVEDEKPISDLIKINLSDAGFHSECAFSGLEALKKIDTCQFDLILMDIMLPEYDGYELLEYIKPLEIPLIFLTAKSDVADKVKGLKLGADDYLTKPFEITELLARVETVLRRYRYGHSIIRIENCTIDTNSRKVKKDNEYVPLTKKEYELLLFFVRNKNIALFRDRIYEKIWDSEYLGDSRTVDLHVQRLRKKLGFEDLIKSVYKVGYRLEINDETIMENLF